MEEYYPSEIARLVLGYLKEVNCTESWKTFLAESSDLAEHNRLHQLGKTHTTNVDGKSLLEILREYCNYKRGTSKNANLNQSNGLNSDEVFRTPLKGNQLCFTKHKIYQKSRTQQVTASPRCEQSGTRLATRVISVTSSPNSAPSPRVCARSSNVRATALNFNRNAQSNTNDGHANESEDFSANRRSYSFNSSPVRNSVPFSPRTIHSDPIRKYQPKKNQTVQTETFSLVDLPHIATAHSVQTKQFLAASNSHNSSLHEIPEENVNSDCDHPGLESDSHSQKTSLAGVTSSLESSERTNPVVSLENQSFVFNESITYQASEITSTNNNITITTLESSLTPQNFLEPPAYCRAPNTNSPRLILSDERSRIPSLTTPQKHRSFEDFYAAASPRRKGFIPRRRLLSGSPGPNQLQNDSAPLLNTLLQDLSASEVELEFARTLADGINKCSELQDLNSSYPNMQVINESQDILRNGLDPRVLDKCYEILNNLLAEGLSASGINDADLKTSDYSKEKKQILDSEDKVVNDTSYGNLNLSLIQSSDYLNANAPDYSADDEQINQNPNLMNSVISEPCNNVSRNEGKMYDSASALCETHKTAELNNELLVDSANIQIDTDDNIEEIREKNSSTEMNSEILKQMDVTNSIDHQNSSLERSKTDMCDSSVTNDFDKDKINNFFNNVEKDLSMHVDKNSSGIQNLSSTNHSMDTTVLLNVTNSNNDAYQGEHIILPTSNQITLNTSINAGNTASTGVSLVAQPAPNIMQTSSLLPTKTIILPPVSIENFQKNLPFQFVLSPDVFLQPGVSSAIAFHQAPVAPLCSVQPISQDYCLSTLNSALEDKSNLNSVANFVTISPAKAEELLKRPGKPSLKTTKKRKQSSCSRKKAPPRKTVSNKTAPVSNKTAPISNKTTPISDKIEPTVEPVMRNLRPRKKQDFSDLFSSPSPTSSSPIPKTPKQRKTNKATESKTYEEPKLISIAEPSPTNRSALELLSEVTGENEIQTPQLRTLLSCVSDLVRKGDRLKSPCVRNLNFEPCDKTPDISPIQRRSSNRSRNPTTKCSCDASPSKIVKPPESSKTSSPSPVHKRKQSPAKTSSNVETQNVGDTGSIPAATILGDEIIQPLEKSIGAKENLVNTHEVAVTIERLGDSPDNTDLLSMPNLSKSKEVVGKINNALKRNQSPAGTSSDIETHSWNDAGSIGAETILSDKIMQPLEKSVRGEEKVVGMHLEATTMEQSGDSLNNTDLLSMPNLSKSKETEGENSNLHKRNHSPARTSSDIPTQNFNDAICTKTILNDEMLQPLEKSIGDKENFVNMHEETVELSSDSPKNVDLLPMPNLSISEEAVRKTVSETSNSPPPKNSFNKNNQKHLSTPNAKYLKRDLYFPPSESESENEHDPKHSSPCSSQSSRITVVEISVDEDVDDTSEAELAEESELIQSEIISEAKPIVLPKVGSSSDISLNPEENSRILLCQQEVQQKATNQKATDAVDSEYEPDTCAIAQEEDGSLVTVLENFDGSSALEQTLQSNGAENESTLIMEHSFPETSTLEESPIEKNFDEDKITSVQKNSQDILMSNVIVAQEETNENANGESKIKNKICALNKLSKLKTPDKNSGETLHNIVENIVSKKKNTIDLITQNSSKNPAPLVTSRKSSSPRRILAPPKKRIRPVTISSPNDSTYHSCSPFYPFESRCPKELELSAASEKQGITQKDAAASVIPIKSNFSERPEAKSPTKIHFHSPLSKKLIRTPAVFNLSPSSGTENITLKELTTNILPIEKQISQSKTPQKYPIHSTPLTGKPKAMAEFYRNISKTQNSAFPISPGSVSSSSCTLDTFIARQKAQDESSISVESRIESPVKNSCDSERNRNSARKRKFDDEPDASVSVLSLQSSSQSKNMSLETGGDSCSPVKSVKRKCPAILHSSPEESSRHSPSKNDAQNSTILIEDSFIPHKSSLDQQSPVKGFPGSKQANKSHLSKKTEQNPHIPAGVKIPSKWKHSNISNYSADILKFPNKNQKPKLASFRSRFKVSALKSTKKTVKPEGIVKSSKVSGENSTKVKNSIGGNVTDGAMEISPESSSSPELPTVEQILAEKVAHISSEILPKKELSKKCTPSSKDNSFILDTAISSQKTPSCHTPSKKRKLIEASKMNILEKYNEKVSPRKAWMQHNKKQKKMNKKSSSNMVISKRSRSKAFKKKKDNEKVSSSNCSKESDTNLLLLKQSTPTKNKTAAKSNKSPKSNNLTLPKNKELDICSPGSQKRRKIANHQSCKETNRNDAMKMNKSAKSFQDTNEKPNYAEIREPTKEVKLTSNVVDCAAEDFQLPDNGPNIPVCKKLEESSALNECVNDNSTSMKNNSMDINQFHHFEVPDKELREEKQPPANDSVAEKSISCNTNFSTKHPVKTHSLSNRRNLNQQAKHNPAETSLSNIKSVLNIFKNIQEKNRLEKCDISEKFNNKQSDKKNPINSLLEKKELPREFRKSHEALPLEKSPISTLSKSNEAITTESAKVTWNKAIDSVLESKVFDKFKESYKNVNLEKNSILKLSKSNKTNTTKCKKVSFSDDCDDISVKRASMTDSSKVEHKKTDKILKASTFKKCEKICPLKGNTASKQSLSKSEKINKKVNINTTEKRDTDYNVKETLDHAVKKDYQNSKVCSSRDSGKDSSFEKKFSSYSSSDRKSDKSPSLNDKNKSKKDYNSKNTSNYSSSTRSKESKTSISNIFKESNRDSSSKRHSDQSTTDKATSSSVTLRKEKEFLLKKSTSKKSSSLEQHKTVEVSNLNDCKKSGQKNETNSGTLSTNYKKDDDVSKLSTSLMPNKKLELTEKTVSDHLISKEAAENLVRISQEELCFKESESAININEGDDQDFLDTQPLERTEEDENEIAQAIAFLHDSQNENSLESQCKSHNFDSPQKQGNGSKSDESQHQSETEKVNVNNNVQMNPVIKNDSKIKERTIKKYSKSKEGIHSRTLSTDPCNSECDSRISEPGNSDGIPAKANNESSASEVKDEKLKLLMEKIRLIGVDNLLSMLSKD